MKGLPGPPNEMIEEGVTSGSPTLLYAILKIKLSVLFHSFIHSFFMKNKSLLFFFTF